MLARVRGRIFYVIVFVLAGGCFVFGATLGDNGVTAIELQQRLIAACQDSRTPLQDYFAGQLAESESHSIAYYRERFPDFPPDELRDAIHEQRENLSTLVETFDPGSCADQYR